MMTQRFGRNVISGQAQKLLGMRYAIQSRNTKKDCLRSEIPMTGNTVKRGIIFLCLCLAVASGFYMWRYYRGPESYWVRYFFSGSVYVIIWCLLFFLLWPSRKNVIRIPIAVFLATCALEFLQLWKPDFLQAFRSTLAGAAILGTSFVWQQFPFYILGAVVSIIILGLLEKIK
jgi:hypothetical protein